MLEKLEETLKRAPIIKKGDYNYFVHPITDGIPLTTPDILEEVVDEIIKRYSLDVDKIVCIEAMGIHLATALSLKTGIPFVVVRKREYGLPGEVAVHQTTGYSEGELYINGINKGDRLLVIDDVVSTGGTLLAVLEALKQMDVKVAKVIVIIEKGEGKKIVEEKTGYKIDTLIRVDITDDKIITSFPEEA